MDLSSKFKDCGKFGYWYLFCCILRWIYVFIPFFLDPRLKVFVERKVYGELRAWFDSRLEDAFKAAEEEGKISPAKGTYYIPFRC